MPAEGHTPGHWKVMQPYRNDGLYQIRRWTCNSYTLKDAEAAKAKCAELNASERVREAAPQLFAACEAALKWLAKDPNYGVDMQVVQRLEAAIKSAKSEGSE